MTAPLSIVENNGHFYLIHTATGKTWRSRFTRYTEANICFAKLLMSWAHDPNMEALDLNSVSFLDDSKDEVCFTVGPNFKRVA